MTVVLAGVAVLAVEPHPPGKQRHLRVVRRDRPAVPVTAENLERVEAPAPRQPPRACAFAVDARAETLASVLDHHEPVRGGDLHHARHIRHPPAQVHRDDALGSRRDRGLDEITVDVEILRHVHQNGRGADVDHRRARRHERVRRHDHLVARPDPRRAQRHVQRVVAAVETDGVPGAHEAGEVLLERLQVASVDQLAVGHHIEVGRIDLRLDELIRPLRIDEADTVRHGLLPDTANLSPDDGSPSPTSGLLRFAPNPHGPSHT